MVGPNDFHFCQVFYNDVRIPLANVVGEVNDGWNVANATLGFERGTGFVADQIQNSELVERLIAMARGRCGLDGLSPRSEARRVGKECVCKCRSRWTPYQETKKQMKDTCEQ